MMRGVGSLLLPLTIGAILYHPLLLRVEELGAGSLFNGIRPFYPLLFLPFFRETIPPGVGRRDLFEGSLALLPLFFGAWTGIQGLIFLGGAWLGLAVAPAAGHLFHLRARLLLLLLPPFSTAPELLFGFPLRIVLSRTATGALAFLDANVRARGNTILFQRSEFTVDPACEGLKMLTALIVLLLLLPGRRSNRIGFFRREMVFLTPPAILLWLAANLVRIVVLIVGKIPAGSPLHEMTGILTFFLIVVLPLIVFRQLLFSNREEEFSSRESDSAYRRFESVRSSVPVLMATALVALAVHLFPGQNRTVYPSWPTTLAGFRAFDRAGRANGEIIAYRRDQMALIIKHNDAVYRLGHNPRQCWQGLGYRFLGEEEIALPGGGRVRQARLIRSQKSGNGKPGAYRLIWWYQQIPNVSRNEKGQGPDRTQTASELVWRLETLLRKRRYVQINLFAPVDQEIIPLAIRISQIKNILPGGEG